ncbi:MAG: dTMP kinase [Kiritimatiellae bacterium]|nr:dTMP kinase [Kiritimatiellia bacterium]
MSSGKFITFEGGECCGKSTQVKLLREALEKEGVEVVLTREPGGTWLSEQIRTLIKDQDEDAPCDRAELLLFLAARAQLVKNVIKPALARGAWVISDRFSDSTLAYQGYGRGLSLEVISIANDFACEGLKPDLTILLSVDPSVASSRMIGRTAATKVPEDRIERAGGEFHSRLRRGFAEIANAEPWRVVTVDANGTPEKVWEEVWTSLKRIR